ncbi:MAG: phospholipase [Curvibacter lanceolatus]|uniref:alpha/beta hydrolase n=1 Tax=Curvibacter lanceolatus TaxID=86182 RepID=UPI0023522142|nr:phospholipase [Curvibacter lanceolatus]MBV5292562.1 phospholipase [Curvibacter lanceolatus]
MPENTALNSTTFNPSVTPPHDLGLQAQFRPAEPGTTEPWLLVLMHGVGSNEQDLMGIAPWVPARYHLLSLRAPHPMGPNAWAWFQFGVAADGSRVINAAQERHSRALVEQAVSRAATQLGVPASRVVVGGFSQGGIMGLSLLLTRPQSLRAALSLHSRLLPEVLPEQAPAEALQGRSLWVSHGTEDAVLPASHSERIVAHAATLPLQVHSAGFPGGHTLGRQELDELSAWLSALV